MIFELLFVYLSAALPSSCPSFSGAVSTIQILSDISFWVVGPNTPLGAFAKVRSGWPNPDPNTGGTQIWETSTDQPNQIFYMLEFNKTFEVPDKTIKASYVYFNIDDDAYVYLNDVYTNCYSSYTVNAKVCDVTQYVKGGLNDFKVKARNTMGPGHLSFRLEVIIIG